MVSTQPISFELPKDVYDYYVNLAEETGQSVEDVMRKTLEEWIGKMPIDPDAVHSLLDDAKDDRPKAES